MRIHAIAFAMALAVGFTSSPVFSQVKREDGGSGMVKGQAEQSADPKQLDPESCSNNAEKPKKPAPPSVKDSPPKPEPDPAKKK